MQVLRLPLPLRNAQGQGSLRMTVLGVWGTHFSGWLGGGFQLHAAGGVHEDEDEVAGFESFVDLLQHAAVKVRAGLVDAGRIDKNDLRGGIRALVRGNLDHAHDAIARGLGLGGDNRHLLAGEGVEERAFADVGPAENGDESGFQRVVVLPLLLSRITASGVDIISA